jgi:glutamine amidotransferase
MIGIIDYGVGNVQAIANIYRRLDIAARLVRTPGDLEGATRLILPGVGAFDWAMTRLNASNLRAALLTAVLQETRPVLGICVGMQMIGCRSDEGVLNGLGWIDGEVKRFETSGSAGERRLPHMGWNEAVPRQEGGLFGGLEGTARFYFLHSYYFAPASDRHVLAVTDYYGAFASSVRSGNVFGVQFHPEKSHQAGIRLLKNFAEL